jgi:uncharacterized protein (DUF983 family)
MMTEEKQEEKGKEKLRCNNCGSSYILHRFRKNERLCRRCGYIEELDEEDNDGKNESGVILNG